MMSQRHSNISKASVLLTFPATQQSLLVPAQLRPHLAPASLLQHPSQSPLFKFLPQSLFLALKLKDHQLAPSSHPHPPPLSFQPPSLFLKSSSRPSLQVRPHLEEQLLSLALRQPQFPLVPPPQLLQHKPPSPASLPPAPQTEPSLQPHHQSPSPVLDLNFPPPSPVLWLLLSSLFLLCK